MGEGEGGDWGEGGGGSLLLLPDVSDPQSRCCCCTQDYDGLLASKEGIQLLS